MKVMEVNLRSTYKNRIQFQILLNNAQTHTQKIDDVMRKKFHRFGTVVQTKKVKLIRPTKLIEIMYLSQYIEFNKNL